MPNLRQCRMHPRVPRVFFFPPVRCCSQCVPVSPTFEGHLKKGLRTRQNAHHSSNPTQDPAEGHSSGKGAVNRGWRTNAAIALRIASNFLSSGKWILYEREKTDQMYALQNRNCSSETEVFIHCIYRLKWRYCKTYEIKMWLSLLPANSFWG